MHEAVGIQVAVGLARMESYMKRTLIVASFFTASLSLAALPAGAQERRPHANGGGRTAASAPAPRQQAGPQAVPRQAPRAGDSRQYRPQVQPRAGDNRQYQQRAMPRAYGDNRQYQQRAQPGAYGRPGYGTPSYGAQPRYGYAVPRPNGGAHYSQPRYSQPHYAQPHYAQPYLRATLLLESLLLFASLRPALRLRAVSAVLLPRVVPTRSGRG